MRVREAGGALLDAAYSGDAGVAWAAVEAMDDLRDFEAEDRWAGLLRHPDPEVGAYALDVLEERGGIWGFSKLRALALDETVSSPALRVQAVHALGSWPPAVCVPVLIKIMEAAPALAPEAGEALAKCTGQDFGPNPAEWGGVV